MEVITPPRDNHKNWKYNDGRWSDIYYNYLRGMDILPLIMMKSRYWSFSQCFEIGLSSWTKLQFIYVGF